MKISIDLFREILDNPNREIPLDGEIIIRKPIDIIIGKPEKSSLFCRLNWKVNPEVLNNHLEKLKSLGIIDYNKLETVLNGFEIPVVIHNEPIKEVLKLFCFWEQCKYIDIKYQFAKRIKQCFQYKNKKGSIKEFSLQDLRNRKAEGDDFEFYETTFDM